MDIEKLLYAAAAQVPGLVVMAWIVREFLKHLGKRDEVLKTIGDNCHEVTDRATVAMNKNTEAYGRVTSMLERVDTTLRKVNGG